MQGTFDPSTYLEEGSDTGEGEEEERGRSVRRGEPTGVARRLAGEVAEGEACGTGGGGSGGGVPPRAGWVQVVTWRNCSGPIQIWRSRSKDLDLGGVGGCAS